MSDRRTTNFSQKGFQGNFLALMKILEKNELCCLDFLSSIFIADTTSVHLSGNGTQSNPLKANSKISANSGNIISINSDGLFATTTGGGGTVTSVGLTMPSAFTVTGSPITTAGTFTVTGSGTTAQYIRGDGSLATFPVTGAVNGLSLIGTNVALGGTLTQDTTVASGGHALIFTDAGFANEWPTFISQYGPDIKTPANNGFAQINFYEFEDGVNRTGAIGCDSNGKLFLSVGDGFVGTQPNRNIEFRINNAGAPDGAMFRGISGAGSATFRWGGQISSGFGLLFTIPTANIYIKAGTAAVGTAPIKFSTGGVLLGTPEPQTIELIDTHIYWTSTAGTRFQLDQQIPINGFIVNGTTQQPTSNFNISGSGIIGGDLSVVGNVNVQGNVSSTLNTNPASITNSGVALTAAPNVADVVFYDSTQTANNRTAEVLFFQGALQMRFKNDSGATAIQGLAITGGQAGGITGITSSSGSGQWIHTGNYVATGTVSSLPSGGNSVVLTGSAFAGTPTIASDGANVNVSLQINTKGAGGITLNATSSVIGTLSVSTLAGTGTRIVVAGATGILSTQVSPISATAILTFPTTAAQSSSDLTISVPGASIDDSVAVSVPPLGASIGTCITAFVSSANTVTVRFNNYSAGSFSPTAQTYKVTVFKF